MLDTLVSGVDVVADRRADARDLAGRDRGADAGAADEDAAFRPSAGDRRAELGGLVGVVDPDRVGVGAEVDDRVFVQLQRLENPVAEVDAAMVEGNGDVHGWTVAAREASRCRAPRP